MTDPAEAKINRQHFFTSSQLSLSQTKGLSETLWDIRTSTYQSCGSEDNNKSNNHI